MRVHVTGNTYENMRHIRHTFNGVGVQARMCNEMMQNAPKNAGSFPARPSAGSDGDFLGRIAEPLASEIWMIVQ